MAQLVASVSGVVVMVVGSSLARGKIFTAFIGSVNSLYPSVYVLIHYIPLSLSLSLSLSLYIYIYIFFFFFFFLRGGGVNGKCLARAYV